MRRPLADHVRPVSAAWDVAVTDDSSRGWQALADAGADLADFAQRLTEVAAARAAACRTVEQDVADLMLALDALWDDATPDPTSHREPVTDEALADLDAIVAAFAAADGGPADPAPRGDELLVLTHESALDDVHALPDVRVHLARIA